MDGSESLAAYSEEDLGDNSHLEKQAKILRITGIIVATLFALNLVLLIINVVFYLIPLKVRSCLLAQFYILAAVNNLARMIELVFFVSNDQVDELPSLTCPDSRP